MRLTFWNINESMNPFVSNFLWAGGMAGRLGWCDTSNLVGVTELHNRCLACLCIFHFSSLACTSYSPIASFSRSKRTRPFLLISCFLYLERKVRGWKTCRNRFFGSSCLCVREWGGRWKSEARSFKAMVMVMSFVWQGDHSQCEPGRETVWAGI